MADLKLEDVDERQLDLEDLTDVVEAMEDVAVNYGSIGLALRIKYSQIEIIERSCHGDARLGLRKVLKQWLSLNYNRQKETSNPSWPCWRKVVEVVDKGCAGHNHALAKKIADKHPYVAGVSGGPEREARMGEVNTATQEETTVPSAEVPLPPSKEATDRSQYTTQSLDAPPTDRPHPPVHEVHSAPVLGQVKLLPPSYYTTQQHHRSVTETANEPSNQNAPGPTSARNSHPTPHTKPINRQPSPIKELERDTANMSVSQPAPCSSHQSSQEGQPSGVSSNMAASRTQYQASQSASITGNNQTGVPPLQSVFHTQYPPQGVPTQRVLPTSPPAVPGPGDELVHVNAPPRQAEVSAGRQPTQPGGDSQLLIAPNSAVRKNYISDNEIDSPSGTTQNFPPNASPSTGKIKEPGSSEFQRAPPFAYHAKFSSISSPEKAMARSHDHLPPVTQTNTVSVPHEPRAPVPPPPTEPQASQEGSSRQSSSQSIAQTPQSSSGGSSRGSAGGRRLKGSSYRLESQQPTTRPHSVDQRASVHQQPPANVQYPPPQASHGQYQPSVSSVRYPMATGGQLNASAPPPSGHISSHLPPSSGQRPPLPPSTSQPPMLLPSSVQQPLQSLQPLQPSGAQQPPGPMPPSSGYSYPVAGQVPAQPQYQAGQFWALPPQNLYYPYPGTWNYYPPQWTTGPPQQNMFPHPPYQNVPPGFPHQGVPPGHPPQTIPPGHSQQSVPSNPHQPREGDPPPGTSHNPQTAGANAPSGAAMLETREGEDEEISEGTVAGTPHEAQSQDEGKLYSDTVLQYKAPSQQASADKGKKQPKSIAPSVYPAIPPAHKFSKIGLSFSHSIIEPELPEAGAKKPENTYRMASSPHGLAVIINNSCFRRHDIREGTHVDCKDLILTFQYLGYNVEEYSDLTSSQISSLFDGIRYRDHSDFDSFVCCILSHGKNNYVYGSDSKKVAVTSITYKLSTGPCPSLKGKPKLFFIQACRGSFTTSGVQIDGENKDAAEKCDLLPSEPPSPMETPSPSDADIAAVADFFVGYSTSADYVSYRDPHYGSWFIWELCHALCNQSTCKPLRDIMDIVHEKVNVEHASLTEKQAPEYSCSLRRKVFFW